MPEDGRKLAITIGLDFGRADNLAADLARMRASLAGFEILELCNEQATRGSILCALDCIADTASPDDIIVLYYSGHGGRAQFVEALVEGSDPEHVWHYLAMPGHGQRFVGILDVELTAKLAAIAASEAAVTAIFDCCFAAPLAREADEVRIFERPDHLPDLISTVQAFSANPLAFDGARAIARITATSSARTAAGVPRPAAGSAFTLALAELIEAQRLEPMSWELALPIINARVRALRGSTFQRATYVGPSGQVMLGRERLPVGGWQASLLESDADGRVGWLEGGKLVGLTKGDEVEIVDFGRARARAEVSDVFPHAARVRFHSATKLRPGSVVYPCRLQQRLDVELHASGPLAEHIEQALSIATRLRRASTAKFVVEADERELCLDDRLGRWRHPLPATPGGVIELIEELDGIARAETFVEAARGSPVLDLQRAWRFRWWRRGIDQDHEVSRIGDRLHHGDQVWFEIEHASARGQPNLYFNLLDQGVAGHLCSLNRAEPAGLELSRGQRRQWYNEPCRRVGCVVRWPDRVPVSTSRPARLWVVVSTAPLDLCAVTAARGARGGHEHLRADPPGYVADFAWTAFAFDYELFSATREFASAGGS